MSVCRWCRRKPAGDSDLLAVWLGQGPQEPLCWRKFNPNDDCFAQEERVKAAAPELLEALKLVASELGQTNEILINRIAEGEPLTCWQEDVQKALDATRAAIAKAEGGQP